MKEVKIKMAKYYVRGSSNTAFGRAKERTSSELRRLKKTYPSLKFVKVKEKIKRNRKK